jgi:hypothetical protein
MCKAFSSVSPSAAYRMLWNAAPQGVMSRAGQYALPWGVETPLLPVGAGRDGTALLDLRVGEPVAYATGSPELKATGPCNSGFRTPRSPRVTEFVCGGVPQTVSRWESSSGQGQEATRQLARVAGGRRPPRLRRGAGVMGARAPHRELPGLSPRGHYRGGPPSPLRVCRGREGAPARCFPRFVQRARLRARRARRRSSA